jgi:hypothetical protein
MPYSPRIGIARDQDPVRRAAHNQHGYASVRTVPYLEVTHGSAREPGIARRIHRPGSSVQLDQSMRLIPLTVLNAPPR